ncbi:DUF3515 domain-containing protein [Nocardioides aurantiacus]|uniref:DUF3515 domain-containing protein n=1 Tax=Nocardioides aurantiacus TaxID=86796 RepID=UPI0014774A69|nr:DUF3515 domain-containing protein [Nocardioides aurantiacus]
MAGVVALGALLAGCGGGVEVSPSRTDGALPAAERRACERLVDDLPDAVGDQPREEVSGNPLAAAWGDPPVVLRCGVGSPADFTPLSTCQEINGVLWFVPEGQITDQGADVVATSMGSLPRVEVAVPAALRPPQGILTDLSDALRAQGRTPDPDEPCS